MSRVCYLGLMVGFLSGCLPPAESLRDPTKGTPSADQTTAMQMSFPRALTARYLTNLVQVHDNVISGGLPEGALAFTELTQLGIKTIISVDSATPDVAMARKHGLKYVHLPHGYDGISSDRVVQLAKAVRELDGPIYIHCHHGKHRSPAAASVACVAAGFLPASQAVAVLQLAGTSPNYRGLFEAAARAQPIDLTVLDGLIVEFPETSSVPPMAEAMVALDRTHEHLLRLAKAGWQSIPEHPDIFPEHEALILQEHFAELRRISDVRLEHPDFARLLQDSESLACVLKGKLSKVAGSDPDAEIRAMLDAMASEILLNCNRCHQKFRDPPRGAK